MSGRADYRFLPWVRRGFRPSDPDPLSGPVADPSEFTIRLTPEAESADGAASPPTEETVDVRMYGPGDVLGFDHRQVVRVEPEPGTTDFEPNYFPMVEFDRPSLPWLFSPSDATSGGKLRPWLCLVVVRQQPGVTLTTGTRRETPILEIGGDADPAIELPDLAESWAWAHAQVVGGPTGDATGGQWVTEQLETNSAQTVARLLASRRLRPNESYHACVVPVFEPGRRAGLGLEPFPDSAGDGGPDSAGDSRRVAPAWDLANMPERIRLPVYFDWEFTTGSGGDFEALVERLEPAELTSVGFRTVDTSDPGPAELAEHRPTDVRVEGALRSAGLDHLPYPSGARDTLAGFLDRVDVTGDAPTFGPPVYGQRHAGVSALPDRPAEGAEGTDGVVPWLRELNVDPRHRLVAGYGTRIVQNEQEALMQSAWTQVSEVRRANRLLQRGQLAREVSQGIHDDVTSLPAPERFAFTASMAHRVRGADVRTVGADVRASPLPSGALTLTFRRLTRPGGPLGSRITRDASGPTPSPTAGVVGAFAPERLAGVRRGETPSPSLFPFEGVTPPDGTVTVGSGDDDEAVASYCAELESQRGERGDPWPPVWVAGLDLEGFPKTGRTICDHAESVLERFEAAISDGSPQNGSLQGLLERFRSAWDRIRPGIERYEEAVANDDRRMQVAVLADLVECCDEATGTLADLEELLDTDTTLESNRDRPLLATYRPLTWLSYGLAILLRGLAYDHLQTDLCALSGELMDRVEPPAEPADGTGDALLAQLTGVSELLCGTGGTGSDDTSVGHGLLHELDGSLRTADEDAHRTSVRRFRDLQRLVAIARDRSDRLADSDEESAADLLGLYADFSALVDHVGDGIGPQEDPIEARLRDLLCDSSPPTRSVILAERPDEDVIPRLMERVTTALDPTRTVEAAVTSRISGLRAARERTAVREDTGEVSIVPGEAGPVDPLDPIMAAPSFPQPMYESLRDLDVEHLLPGVGDVPPDSLGLLETNPAFVEAYLVGLNHEMARELNWREYPTDRRGTYFRRFWDRRGAVPPKTGDERDDIEGIHRWPVEDGTTRLGDNLLRGGATSDAVLLVRGELLRRYPNTVIYAVRAERVGGKRRPVTNAATEAPPPGTPGVEYPVFRGTIDPDITFLGFDVSTEDLVGGTTNAPEGYFLVVEEAPGEPRFGLDEPGADEPDDGFGWEDTTWAHVAPDGDPDALSYVPVLPDGPPGVPSPPTTPFEWGRNGAHMAGITWQKPFRIGVHASDMLPNEGEP